VETYNTTAQPGSPGILNVALHGTFALIRNEQAKQIRALIPAIGHHVCRAGSWLGETALVEASEYELTGVETGNATFEPEKNLIVRCPTQASLAQPSMTLRFPLPRQITSLRIGEIPRRSFLHAEELAADSETQRMATLHIFTYDIADENNLCLRAPNGGGHYWEPVPNGNYVNLHIFSAEDHLEGPSNAAGDFKKCAELLGLQLELTGTLLAGEIPGDGCLPAGVAAEETEDLAPRTLRLARLGRLVTGNGDANLAWYANDALDSNPSACSGPICLG
jgi:hypothetical protein